MKITKSSPEEEKLNQLKDVQKIALSVDEMAAEMQKQAQAHTAAVDQIYENNLDINSKVVEGGKQCKKLAVKNAKSRKNKMAAGGAVVGGVLGTAGSVPGAVIGAVAGFFGGKAVGNAAVKRVKKQVDKTEFEENEPRGDTAKDGDVGDDWEKL